MPIFQFSETREPTNSGSWLLNVIISGSHLYRETYLIRGIENYKFKRELMSLTDQYDLNFDNFGENIGETY